MEAQASTPDRIASARELATAFDQTDFPIWDQGVLKDIPSNQEWANLANPFLVTVRLSALLMTKDKDELVTLVGDLEERDVDGVPLIEDLVPRMHAAEAFFRDMLNTVEGAETRLLGAACKKAVLEGQPGLDDH
jgi:hypothetical protein